MSTANISWRQIAAIFAGFLLLVTVLDAILHFAAPSGIGPIPTPIAISAANLVALFAVLFYILKSNARTQIPPVRKSRQELEFIFNHSVGAIAVCDKTGRVLEVNEEWRRHPYLGQYVELIPTRSLLVANLFDDSSRQSVIESFKSLKQNKQRCKLTLIQQLPRERYSFTATLDFLPAGGGKVLVRLEDESKYREALGMLTEQNLALLDAESRYSQVVAKAGDAIVLIDAETLVITECNPAFERLTGCNAFDLLGKNIIYIFPPEEIEDAAELFRPMEPGESPRSLDLELVGADGKRVIANFRTVRLDLGDQVYILAIARDVTERYELERDLIARNLLFSRIVKIGKALNESLKLSDIVDTLDRELKDLFHYTRFSLLLADEQNLGAFRAECRPPNPARYPLGEDVGVHKSPLWQSFKSGMPSQLFVGKLDVNTLESFGVTEAYPGAIQSLLVVNMIYKNELLGLLVFESDKPDSFDTPTISFITQLSSQLAAILQNARLLEFEKRRSEQFALIYKLSQRVLESLHIDTILKEAGRNLIELFGYDNVFLFLVDEAIGSLYLYSSVGKDGDYIDVGLRVPVGEGLIGIAAQSGKTQFAPDCSKDERFVNHFPGALNIQSEIAIPITKGRHILGVLDVANRAANSFKESDIAVLETVASQLASALMNAYNFENLKEHSEALEAYKEHIANDLELASRIQGNLLPVNFVNSKLELAYRYLPHAGVGGDYAKVVEKDNWLYLIIGDVSGHGVSASLVMSAVNSQVERMISSSKSPAEIAEEINRFIAENFEFMGLYLTFFCGRLDTETDKFEYVNAGHPAVIVQNPQSAPVKLTSSNFPLGLIGKNIAGGFAEDVIYIHRGGRIVMYTDGLLDEKNDGYNEEMLIADLELLKNEHVNYVANRIVELSSDAFPGEANDDRLLVIAEYREKVQILEYFSTISEVDKVIAKLVDLCHASGYSEEETMILRLSSYEMMVNSVKHGHKFDEQKRAYIKGELLDKGWQFTIRDQGCGFDYESIGVVMPDDEDFFRTSGRGINLTRRILDKVSFEDGGRCVILERNFPNGSAP
ncbi:MAG: SpoIIE family protein phosphatase [bacterium]|jgi:PAS domain S-box-containing protein